MTQRIGIDLVAVDDVREALSAHGEHYLQRIFTAQEVRDCTTSAGPSPERLAGRFAAKEAALKVLRPSARDACPLGAIEVFREDGGWVSLRLAAEADALAADAGIEGIALSISHEGGFATAVVIAEVPQRCR